MRKIIGGLLTLGAAVVVACGAQSGEAQHGKAQQLAVSAHPSTCATPAPNTASGYAAMFNRLNPAYWAGADGAIATKMPSGLVLWLWSDTISTGRFVHSSAIVQYKGCAHVSYNGAQLLPNETSRLIYWIDSVRAISATDALVRAQQIKIRSLNSWDFAVTGVFKTARVHITIYHNVKFVGWTKTERNAKATRYPYTKNILQCAVYHNSVALTYPTKVQLCPKTTYGAYGYNPQVYPFIRLASGKLLLSVSFNSNDVLVHPEHYRPKFFEI